MLCCAGFVLSAKCQGAQHAACGDWLSTARMGHGLDFVALVTSPRPIVNPNHRRWDKARTIAPPHEAQQGVVAHRRHPPPREASRWPCRPAHARDDGRYGRAARFAAPRCQNVSVKALREHPPAYITPRHSGTGAPQRPAEQTCPQVAGPPDAADIGCESAPILFQPGQRLALLTGRTAIIITSPSMAVSSTAKPRDRSVEGRSERPMVLIPFMKPEATTA